MQKVLIDGTVYFDRDKELSGRAAKKAEKQKAHREGEAEQQRQNARPSQEAGSMKLFGIAFLSPRWQRWRRCG